MAPRLVLDEAGKLVLENVVGDDVFSQSLGITRAGAIRALAELDTLGPGLTLTIRDGRIGTTVKGLSVSAAAAELVTLGLSDGGHGDASESNETKGSVTDELLLEALMLTPSFGDERGTVREDPATNEVVFIFSVGEVGGERKVVRLPGCAHLRENFKDEPDTIGYLSSDGYWQLIPAPESIGAQYLSVVQVKSHLGYINTLALLEFIELGGAATDKSIDPDTI